MHPIRIGLQCLHSYQQITGRCMPNIHRIVTGEKLSETERWRNGDQIILWSQFVQQWWINKEFWTINHALQLKIIPRSEQRKAEWTRIWFLVAITYDGIWTGWKPNRIDRVAKPNLATRVLVVCRTLMNFVVRLFRPSHHFICVGDGCNKITALT